MTTPKVVSVHLGKTAPLGPKNVPSAFVKHAVTGAVDVELLGIDGDEQADLRVHGGAEKAVYGYALSHYTQWATEFPQHTDLFQPGGVGENLCIEGMDESALCVGDVHAIGTTLLQVCQPRQPCFKFSLRFNNPHLPGEMVRNGRSGWYYRVLKAGALQAGDEIKLYERPNPDFPFQRLVELIYQHKASMDDMKKLAVMEGLASQWQQAFQAALQKGE